MATNTYVALDRIIVGTSTPSVTFTGISQAYTNLEIVVNGGFVSNNDELCVRFNGDTGNNYSTTFAIGDGGAAVGTRQSNASNANLGRMGSTALRGISRIVINDYKDPNINKTVFSRTGSAIGPTGGAGGYVYSNVSLWRATPQAITSMTFFEAGGFNILAGTTFSLYGILAEGSSPAPKAIGGAIYSDSTHYYHVFGSTGVFTPSTSLTCDYVVVAGGGGGGGQQGGGGGAGGLRAFASASLSATNYPVTVGAGGNGGFGNASRGVNGSNSSFNSNSVTGGGGGATNGIAAGSGGSGGGGGINSSANGSGNAGSYSPVEGFAGGATSLGDGGAGGGGAAAAGTAKNGSGNGQNGGIGASVYNSIDFTNWLTATGLGTSGKLAGGGGGGTSASFSVGIGGAGGGGTGGNVEQGAALPYQNGVFASGGGGGGGSQFNANANGGNGGSGVVIVRYLKA